MLAIGIIVSIIAILLAIFPKFFLNLKSPDTAFLQMKKTHNNKKSNFCSKNMGNHLFNNWNNFSNNII